jgi:hypothetical protein
MCSREKRCGKPQEVLPLWSRLIHTNQIGYQRPEHAPPGKSNPAPYVPLPYHRERILDDHLAVIRRGLLPVVHVPVQGDEKRVDEFLASLGFLVSRRQKTGCSE